MRVSAFKNARFRPSKPWTSLASWRQGPVDIRFDQKFRKGVGEQRGLARGNPWKARDSGLFSVPFFLCPLRRRGHISGEFFGLFWAVCLSPTPSRQPLFETSDSICCPQLERTFGKGVRRGSPSFPPSPSCCSSNFRVTLSLLFLVVFVSLVFLSLRFSLVFFECFLLLFQGF